MSSRGHALSRDELIRTLTAYTGITTSDGALVGGRGTTLIDSTLIDNPYISPSGIPEKTVLIMSGNARGEDKGAASFDNVTGKITLQGAGFSAQIVAGTIYRILNISSVESLIAGLISFAGTTTSDGGAGGSSLICSDLAAEADFDGNQVVITTGDYRGQARDITADTTGGTVTPHLNFGGVIVEGTEFIITAMRTVPAEVADIEAKLDHAEHGLAALHGDIGDKGAGVDIITRLGAFTAAQNLKAILGDLSTTKNLGGVLGALTTTNNLKAIIGAYTAAANLKAAIDTIDTAVTAIKAVTDVIPDSGALTALLASIASILEDTGTTLPATLSAIAGYIDTEIVTIDGIVDNILLDTQVRKVASGSSGVIATTATKYIELDSLTNGAEILSVIINGVVGADWTLDIYVPAADAVAAPAAADKRDSIPYVAADTEGGLLKPFAIAYNAFLKFTNDSGGNQTITDVVVVYRSRAAVTVGAWT